MKLGEKVCERLMKAGRYLYIILLVAFVLFMTFLSLGSIDEMILGDLVAFVALVFGAIVFIFYRLRFDGNDPG